MKILVLVEDLRINKTSAGIGRSKFIQAISNEGDSVFCLYGGEVIEAIDWIDNVSFSHVKNTNSKKKIIDYIPKVRAIPTYLNGYDREFNSNIKSWKNEIEFMLLKTKYDLIIALGSGVSFLPHYAMLEIKTAIPWVANFHDPYPLSLYPEPYRVKNTIIYKKQESNAKEIIRKATYISFPSLLLKEWMQQYFPEIKNKFIILPHIGMELNNLPSSENDELVELDKNKFNILHAGTLLGPRKVESLFQAFDKFINSNIEIKENTVLSVLGKVHNTHGDIISRNNFNYNIITERVSYKRSLELTKQADISLIIEADADISPFMPGKLADLIFLEKPILAITPLKSETLRILGEDYPFSARSNDVDRIYSLLLKMWQLKKDNKLILQNKDKLKSYISVESLNKNINNILND